MTSMKTVLSVLLLAATAASAESIHIKGIRQATDAEKAYKTAFKHTNSEVKIQVTDKKGRESTESLHIMGVKEQ
jgi:hypothetical protein